MTEAEFLKTRVAYCQYKDELYIQDATKEPIKRRMDWIREDVGVTAEDAEEILSGAIFSDEIYMCQGSNYKVYGIERVPECTLRKLVRKHHELYGVKPIMVTDGKTPGELGEEWQAIRSYGKFTDI